MFFLLVSCCTYVFSNINDLKLAKGTSVSYALITSENVTYSVVGDSQVDENTVFEIGSLTKVFTGLLLAIAIQDKPYLLDEKIADYIPEIKKQDVANITFQQLVTHSSGLPRLPESMNLFHFLINKQNPYKNYTTQKLIKDLNASTLTKLKEQSLYSNYGYAVLGLALERAMQQTYAELIQNNILEPLTMEHSFVNYNKQNQKQVIRGYKRLNIMEYFNFKTKAPNWHFDAAAPAGAMKSSTKDLAKFISTYLSLDSDLKTEMKLTLNPYFIKDKNRSIGLGWQIYTKGKSTIYWHNGATAGYRSFFGFNPRLDKGIVLLCNYNDVEDLDKVGFNLLYK